MAVSSPAPNTPSTEHDDQDVPSTSPRTVYVSNVRPGCLPSAIYDELDFETGKLVTEILTHSSGRRQAWIVFMSEEAATNFTETYDSTLWGGYRIRISPGSTSLPYPDRVVRWTEFHRQAEELQAVKSATVKISGLNRMHPRRAFKCLWKTFRGDEEDYPETDIVGPGVLLARVDDVDTAVEFVEEFNGTCFKTATIQLKCVPDDSF
jgi:hypothetical protein